MTSQIGQEFEREVRAVARARWHLRPGEGAAEHFASGEIDCVCRTEDVVHLIECTIERTRAKVNEQVNKLALARDEIKEKEKNQGRVVKLWIVTREEPTPDQRTAASRHDVAILSLLEFRRQLVNANDYLTLRWDYRFGSASLPTTGSPKLGEEEYIPIPIVDTSSGEMLSVNRLADLLQRGRTLVLLGSFGAGKSFTLRQVFRELRTRCFKGETLLLPIALNLREHWGETDTAEVLERHGKRVGFQEPYQLVRAWNAAQCVALLDGFDELASQGWQLLSPREFQPHRLDAVTLVRNFVQEAQSGHPRIGVLLAGRDNYFDSPKEMQRSLGLRQDTITLRLEDFTEEQADRFLAKKLKRTVTLPAWLPRKPLLLSYLPVKGLLEDVMEVGEKGPAYAWDRFIQNICEREASLNPGSIDSGALRHLLQHLATKTRESVSGTGPLTENDVVQAFRRITRTDPLEPARVLLVCLPGLTARDEENGTRSFLDVDMLDALRASTVTTFIVNPQEQLEFAQLRHPLNQLGCSMVALYTDSQDVKPGAYVHAARRAIQLDQPTLALDCLISGAQRLGSVSARELTVGEGSADVIDLDEYGLEELTLDTCVVRLLRLGEGQPRRLYLRSCLIERIEGVANASGMPDWIVGALVGDFEELKTTASILKRTTYPLSVRVLLTCLHKVFEQRGRGRMESALYRGLSQDERRYVGDLLKILDSENVVFSTPTGRITVWHPNPLARDRVRKILSAPMASTDPILARVKELS